MHASDCEARMSCLYADKASGRSLFDEREVELETRVAYLRFLLYFADHAYEHDSLIRNFTRLPSILIIN